MVSLFEQYEMLKSADGIKSTANSGRDASGILNLRSNIDEPIFSRNKIDFSPPNTITHMVVSNNQLLMAMINKTLLKIDLMNPSKPTEIDMNLHLTDKNRQANINRIFIDFSGKHCLISMTVGFKEPAAYENYYYNRKVHLLSKMKGHILTSVGWNPSGNESGTRNILIGTTEGKLFETQLQSDDRFLASRELYWKQVFDFSANNHLFDRQRSDELEPEPICAINWFELKNGGAYCILVATSNFLYQFSGTANSFEESFLYQIFLNPTSRAYKEVPGRLQYSQLDLFFHSQCPKSFGWLTKPGIFYGEIPSNLTAADENRIFDHSSMIMYNEIDANSPQSEKPTDPNPISLILTQFHLLLLYPNMLKAVCVLNQQVVQEDEFIDNYGKIVGICKDPIRNTIWVYTERAVYRYKVVQEDRNIWEIYLSKKDFRSAKHYAGNDLIKLDRTICEEALHHFSNGDYKTSAQLFASTRSKSFEEIALKFIELKDKDQEALKEFLLLKLATLSAVKERTQTSILLLWLFEILLNQLASVNNAMLDTDLTPQLTRDLQVDYNRIESQLKSLISNSNYKACLKRNKLVVYNLIRNHGNQSILTFFAEQIDDFECLIEHHLQSGQYERALNILRIEECLDLYYRYSPIIVQHLPSQLANQLMPLASQIDFAKLIPALVHFDHSNDQENVFDSKRETQCKEILRFLEYCVFNLETTNSLVHNYLIALYAQYQPDKLLTYLQLKGDESTVLFDIRYAARICTQIGDMPQATIHLLTAMGAFEEAVEQALMKNDVELAKQTAEKVQSMVEKTDLAKRLWLKIAKHVIKNIYVSKDDKETLKNNQLNIKMATSILNECPLLKIEDILPYFPEFLTIDHFKEAICQSLEEYNRNIETLRDDMKLATESAHEIREEIRQLRNRFVVIDSSERCIICNTMIMSRAFYAFHCGHLFHSDCLIVEIRSYLDTETVNRLDHLLASIKSLQSPSESESGRIDQANQCESLQAEVDDIVSNDCLLCGNAMISSVDKPFIDPTDISDLRGWD